MTMIKNGRYHDERIAREHMIYNSQKTHTATPTGIETAQPKQIPVNVFETYTAPLNDCVDYTPGSLDVGQPPKDVAAELRDVQEKLAKERERGNNFCDQLVATRRKMHEALADLENARAEIKRQNELLAAAYHDDRLLFAVMEKAVAMNKKLQRLTETEEE